MDSDLYNLIYKPDVIWGATNVNLSPNSSQVTTNLLQLFTFYMKLTVDSYLIGHIKDPFLDILKNLCSSLYKSLQNRICTRLLLTVLKITIRSKLPFMHASCLLLIWDKSPLPHFELSWQKPPRIKVHFPLQIAPPPLYSLPFCGTDQTCSL